mgnify:CR=1 FL=1
MRRSTLLAVVAGLVFASCMAAAAEAQAVGLPAAVGETPMPSLAPMIKRVSPAVVNIATRGTVRQRAPRNPLLDDPFFRRFFDIPEMGPRERQFQSAGSGVIFDARKGHIVTNAHVIENETKITIYICNPHDVPKARNVLQTYFAGHPPGSTLCILRGLANPNFLLEIESIAAV